MQDASCWPQTRKRPVGRNCFFDVSCVPAQLPSPHKRWDTRDPADDDDDDHDDDDDRHTGYKTLAAATQAVRHMMSMTRKRPVGRNCFFDVSCVPAQLP
jgi:hypothetical protein